MKSFKLTEKQVFQEIVSGEDYKDCDLQNSSGTLLEDVPLALQFSK